MATPAPAASGLQVFNLDMLRLLIKSCNQGAILKQVAEVVGSQHAIKEIALCADLLNDWESFDIKLNMLFPHRALRQI